MEKQVGRRVLEIESGVVRIRTILGVEKAPGVIGGVVAATICYIAMFGKWFALYGLILPLGWFMMWRVLYGRDPQFWKIMWRKEWWCPLPSVLYPAPGVIASQVELEPTVPVRGEAGLYGE